MLPVRLRLGVAVLLLAAPALAWAGTAPPAQHSLGTLPADSDDAGAAAPRHSLGTLPMAAAPAMPAASATDAGPTDAPLPDDQNAPPQAFIQAALRALAAGRLPEAGNAIEQAESRALTRSVVPSTADRPSQQPLVQQLSQARQALAAGDRLRAVGLLEAAAKNPQANAK